MELLSQKEAARYSGAHAYRIRVFDPRGLYPSSSFALPDALYQASPELVYTAVWSRPFDQLSSDLPYSEMNWATPEELRFWSSILLSEDGDGPLVMLYPHFNTYVLSANQIDLSDATVQAKIRELLHDEAAKCGEHRWGGDIRNCWNAGYSLFEHEYHHDRRAAFYTAISVNDHCLLRGVSCLIKCDMLSRHYEFSEEAGLVVFVALDASYSLVLERLRKDGIKNPSAKDAGAWLDETFNRPIGLQVEERGYFEDYYTQRIMSIHPSSRFGVALYAPFLHDDYMMLRRDLRELFAYLVLSEHGPEFQRRLVERNRASAP